MGFTYVKIKASNLMKPELKTELELLVDTGSVLTWIPRKPLEALGIKPKAPPKLNPVEE